MIKNSGKLIDRPLAQGGRDGERRENRGSVNRLTSVYRLFLSICRE